MTRVDLESYQLERETNRFVVGDEVTSLKSPRPLKGESETPYVVSYI